MVSNPKIMVVEDNDFVRMQIVKFLADEGYQTVECTDGQDALNTISDDIAVAICDIRMEPMDGFQFIKSIRASDVTTPVVLVTGDDNPDLLNRANKWGVAAVLMKPVQKDRLLKTVDHTLKMQARGVD